MVSPTVSARRKRSLGRSSLTEGEFRRWPGTWLEFWSRTKRSKETRDSNLSSRFPGCTVSPKKTKLETTRNSIEKASKLRTSFGGRIKTPLRLREAITARRTLIPVYRKVVSPSTGTPSQSTEDICLRLRQLEVRVQQNTDVCFHVPLKHNYRCREF